MTDTIPTTAAGRPNRRALSKQRTRAKVIETAKALFAAGGYEEATMRSIAKAAGFSTGSIFANYDSKAELYEEIYGHPPVSPEWGRRAILVLGAMVQQASMTGSIIPETMNEAQTIVAAYTKEA